MSTPQYSLNLSALSLIEKLCSNSKKYGVIVEKTSSGATLIDAGIQARGGFSAGNLVTEICLGGYGEVPGLSDPNGRKSKALLKSPF